MKTLDEILQACCDVLGVSPAELIDRERTTKSSLARGMYYVIAKENHYHPTEVSSRIGRSRAACIIITKRYLGYLFIGDKYIRSLYEAIINLLK